MVYSTVALYYSPRIENPPHYIGRIRNYAPLKKGVYKGL
ncbi:PBSX family phage terminase, large subunit domain protein [Bacteroides fragilis str. S6L8]|nr:PBSX family phage terminase, large subunit domain protein [Bacteroides fragilis str. S6L8]